MTMTIRPRISCEALQLLLVLLVWNIGLKKNIFCHGSGWIDVNSRHQESLSTFDTNGKLLQVEYAMEAAAMGAPVIAVCDPDIGIILASPQVLPSPLMLDDGTARFVRVSSDILVAHSGLSADGRVIMTACQELAIQHEYVYDEPIPLDIFLEEMSLLYQEHTMKPAVRPFGTTLVVAYYQKNSEQEGEEEQPNSSNNNCGLYRIDPSGAVECLGNYAVINGDKLQSDNTLLQQLADIANKNTNNTEQSTIQDLGLKVVNVLHDALRRSSSSPSSSSEGQKEKSTTKLSNKVRRILTASLSHEEGMVLGRYDPLRLHTDTEAEHEA